MQDCDAFNWYGREQMGGQHQLSWSDNGRDRIRDLQNTETYWNSGTNWYNKVWSNNPLKNPSWSTTNNEGGRWMLHQQTTRHTSSNSWAWYGESAWHGSSKCLRLAGGVGPAAEPGVRFARPPHPVCSRLLTGLETNSLALSTPHSMPPGRSKGLLDAPLSRGHS